MKSDELYKHTVHLVREEYITEKSKALEAYKEYKQIETLNNYVQKESYNEFFKSLEEMNFSGSSVNEVAQLNHSVINKLLDKDIFLNYSSALVTRYIDKDIFQKIIKNIYNSKLLKKNEEAFTMDHYNRYLQTDQSSFSHHTP